jgi:hypothetical protein
MNSVLELLHRGEMSFFGPIVAIGKILLISIGGGDG